jgi:hypothetical protein
LAEGLSSDRSSRVSPTRARPCRGGRWQAGCGETYRLW